MGKWFEIWRAGNYPQEKFKEEDVQEIVDNYDPKTEEAPIVLGHPKKNDPAFGWVEELAKSGKSLLAKFRQVVPEFAQAVNEGRYKKISIRLAKTPEKGWTLKHVGFLGAAAPQVKGLAPISFNADDEGINVEVNFTDIPPTLTEIENKKEVTIDMTEEERKALREELKKDLEAEFAQELAQKEEDYKKKLADAEFKAKKAEFIQFVTDHRTQLPPAVRAGLAEFMATLSEQEEAVEFTDK